MRPLVLVLLLTPPLLAPGGAREGRGGNARLAARDAAGAEAAFREGLARSANAEAGTRAGDARAALGHNLGLALYAQAQFAEAAAAFEQALDLAPEPALRARLAYDAGTALARADSLDAALALLRRALVLDPAAADARHNYAWVKRRLKRNQERQNEPSRPPEPSPFAVEVKARADALVAARRYGAARDLLRDGLQRDSTVSAFAEALRRLDAVVAIESDSARPPR